MKAFIEIFEVPRGSITILFHAKACVGSFEINSLRQGIQIYREATYISYSHRGDELL